MKVTNKTPAENPEFTPKTLEITFESQEELNYLTKTLGNTKGAIGYSLYILLSNLGGED